MSDTTPAAPLTPAPDPELLGEVVRDLRRLARSTETLANEMVKTNTNLAEVASLRRRNGVLGLVIGGLVLLLLCVIIGGGIYVIVGQDRLAEVQAEGRANGAFIRECVTPGPHKPTAADPTTGHACYDDGQARTGAAIDAISSQIVAKLRAQGVAP